MADWGIVVTGLTNVRQQFAVTGQRVLQRVHRIFTRRLGEGIAHARSTYLTGGTTATRLAERTGRLSRSFAAEVSTHEMVVMGRIGYIASPPAWARVHEGWPDGRASTTIRPRSAHYLAIPLTAEAQHTRPRQMAGTFVQRSRRGNLLIFQKTGSGTLEPAYLLRREVLIPARPALRPTMARFLPLILEDMRHLVPATFQA